MGTPHRTPRRHLALALAAVAALALTGCTAAAAQPAEHAVAPTASATPTTTSTPSPTPTDPTSLLLAQADAQTGTGGTNESVCAISFAGADIAAPPQLQQQGERYSPLPIPERSGWVFAGWYASPDAAAARDVGQRVNGADLAQCTHRRTTLFGAWDTPAQVAAVDTGVPILMYHQFTTNPNGESGWLRANYTYSGAFDSQMAYIAAGGFYLPTWHELDAFIDGKLSIPKRCVIITDDDADPSWFQIGMPIIQKYRLMTTSFVITQSHPWPSPSIWVMQRSHTNDMHRAGANGKGRMVNLPAAEIAADMETSATILGAKEVMSYPYGHYDDTAKEGLREAGFDMAVTIEGGYVRAGSDKLALPRMRMSYGATVDRLAYLIG